MSRLRKCFIGAIGVVILLLVGGIYWYFGVYRNTPSYALEKVEYALEKHDKALFYEYVDMTSVLDSAYDSILKSLMDSDATMSDDAKTAALEAVKILKSPVLHGFQKAIDYYIENGSWNIADNKNGEDEFALDISEVISQSGVENMVFRGVDEIIELEKNEAVALLQVYHNELEREFVFEVVMKRADNKNWKVFEVRNFDEFVILIRKARREKINNYLEESRKIWQKHEDKMRDADFDLQRILGAKSLGKQGTRGELKTLMLDRVASDWQERKAELEALDVPKEVAVLHKLRLKIAGLHIEYAEGYAAWLDDKKAATLRVAEDKIKQAKTLEQEAVILEKRITNK